MNIASRSRSRGWSLNFGPRALVVCRWSAPWTLPRFIALVGVSSVALLATLFATWETIALLLGFYLNPFTLTFLRIAIAWTALSGAIYSDDSDASHSEYNAWDRFTAEWYWWNAWLLHVIMGGSTGMLRLMHLIARFPSWYVVPWTLELVLLYPLHVWTCYAIVRKLPSRYRLEFVTSLIQIVGAVVFAGTMHGAEEVESRLFRPTVFDCAYTWFGYWVCDFMWGIVPLYRMYRATMVSQRLIYE